MMNLKGSLSKCSTSKYTVLILICLTGCVVYLRIFFRLVTERKERTPLECIQTNAKGERKTLWCLEPNICKENKSMEYYTYHRNDTFKKMLNIPPNFKKNITHDKRVVPDLVHFTWFSALGPKRKPFLFHYMIAVLAAHKTIKPERIFLWIDLVPEGKYFKELQSKVPELYLIKKELPKEIYGRPVKVPEHVSDIVRLEAMLEYGGMYFDLDSIVVNSLDPLLKYEMVMGYEVPYALCNGVLIATPFNDFMKIWHSRYRTFNDSHWADHSVLLPAALAKNYTNLLHTEESSICHPNWTGKEMSQLYAKGNYYDWKKKNYVVHLWFKLNGVNYGPEHIKTFNNTVGEILRYVYYGNSDIITTTIASTTAATTTKKSTTESNKTNKTKI